ncbi:hypothetical protein GGE12_000260 [Rhizobium mongolense]|uniref:Uncharacterized protein n=1 Tax=Rhizobium mongolense TaxID=57676 RepID=A0A7W6RHB0_9HYPH|nr:hypothetical protein [Rhizobium mongolense]
MTHAIQKPAVFDCCNDIFKAYSTTGMSLQLLFFSTLQIALVMPVLQR